MGHTINNHDFWVYNQPFAHGCHIRDLTNKIRSMKSKGMGIEWEKVMPPIAKLTCHLIKGRVYNMI